MDRLDELAVLVAIVEAGSLIGAARRLRRSPPAVTRMLAALEARVGARLIERTTRRLAPTHEGREIAERARIVLAEYEHATDAARAAALHGLLRITAPAQFGRRHVAGVVSSFLDAHPGIQVELVLNDRNLDLVEDGLDVAVRIGPMPPSTLLARRVGEVRRVLVASPAYLAARGTPDRPAALAAHDTIFTPSRPGSPEWRFGGTGKHTAVRLAPRLIVNEVEASLLAARAGRGLCRALSYQVAEDLAAGTLVRLLQAFEPPALPVHLVTHGGPYRAPKVAAFLDHAATALRGLPVLAPG